VLLPSALQRPLVLLVAAGVLPQLFFSLFLLLETQKEQVVSDSEGRSNPNRALTPRRLVHPVVEVILLP
jgi:hypothetical protein